MKHIFRDVPVKFCSFSLSLYLTLPVPVSPLSRNSRTVCAASSSRRRRRRITDDDDVTPSSLLCSPSRQAADVVRVRRQFGYLWRQLKRTDRIFPRIVRIDAFGIAISQRAVILPSARRADKSLSFSVSYGLLFGILAQESAELTLWGLTIGCTLAITSRLLRGGTLRRNYYRLVIARVTRSGPERI